MITFQLQAQTKECSTPDRSAADLSAILSQLPQTSLNSQSSPWRVPIWFYHLRHADGSSFFPNFDPESAIGSLNQYFNGLFEFTICGNTNIDDEDYVVMNLSTEYNALMVDVDNLNQPLSENCVRIFLTGNPGLIIGNDFPSGYAFDRLAFGADAGVFVGVTDMEIWAHEIGHYFGLPHTFRDPSTQYVHDENHPVSIGGVQYSCFQTGDGFCDTPADLEVGCNYSLATCNTPATCNITDPIGTPYAPDPTLLMSYYGGCRNRFSNEQKQVMRTLYLSHPNYAAILNAPNECLIPKYGKIERNCVSVIDPQNNIPDFTPMANVPVEVRDINFICNAQNNLTDNNGKYQTEPCALVAPLRKILPSKNHPDELNGVNVGDVLLVKAHVVNNLPFQNPFQMIAADVNNTGTVTFNDASIIQQVILNPAAKDFPAGNWRYVPKLCTETQAFLDQFWDDVQPLVPGIQPNPFDAVFIDPFQGFQRHYLSAGPNLPNNDSWMDQVSLNITEPASHNDAAWSFTGIKVGDVNCSAVVDGLLSEDPDGDFAVNPHAPIGINQIFTIQIKAIGNTPIAGWQMGVEFDQEKMQFLEIQPGTTNNTFSIDNFGILETSEGKLRALNVGEIGVGQNLNNLTLFKIRMKALQPIANIGQYFHLKNSVLPEVFISATGNETQTLGLLIDVQSGGMGLAGNSNGIQQGDFRDPNWISVYPVPFSSEIAFDFSLPEEEDISISVFDSYGRLIVEQNELLSKGFHTIKLNRLDNWPSGVYWYSFKAGEQSNLGKIFKQ